MAGKRWSETETIALMKVWKVMSDSDAARIVGRSLSACRGKADGLYCTDPDFRKAIKERYEVYSEAINGSRSRSQVGCTNHNRNPKPRDGSGRFIRVEQRGGLAERDNGRTVRQRERMPARTNRDNGNARFADNVGRCDPGSGESDSTVRLSVRNASDSMPSERMGNAITNASAASERILG
jgi:hypothetical protein